MFYFSFFKAPVDVCNQIRRIQAKFLWGWGYENKTIAWVNWKTICSLVVVGGVGIKDIGSFNDALLAKWKWRFGVSKNDLWRDIIELRFGNWRNMEASLGLRKEYVVEGFVIGMWSRFIGEFV